MTTVVVVLNGQSPTASQLKFWSEKGVLYAGDGGAQCCLSAGIRPHTVIGDFDSLDLKRLPADWNVLHRPDQNATDFEKVLSVLPENPKEIVILGGLGDRLDHTLTNLLIAGAVHQQTRLQFVGTGDSLVRVTPDTPFSGDLPAGETLSLLPLQHVGGVSTGGLKWNLTDHDMGPGGQLGQSNRVEGPLTITVRRGILWVWHGNPS